MAAAQSPKQQRQADHAEVRFGLATARREEQQVERLAVQVSLVDEPGGIEQDETELERAPGRHGFTRVPFRRPLPCGQRHRAVHQPECLTGLGVVTQRVDALREAIRGNPGAVQQQRARLESLLGAWPRDALGGALFDPAPVLAHERQKGDPQGLGRLQRGQNLHAQFHAADICRHDPTHGGPRDPGNGHAVWRLLDPDAMAHGVAQTLAETQVRDALVRVVARRGAHIRPRQERSTRRRSDDDLDLEQPRLVLSAVRAFGLGVHDEKRHGAGARRESCDGGREPLDAAFKANTGELREREPRDERVQGDVDAECVGRAPPDPFAPCRLGAVVGYAGVGCKAHLDGQRAVRRAGRGQQERQPRARRVDLPLAPVRLRRDRRRALVHVVPRAGVVVDLRVLGLAVNLAGQEAGQIPPARRDGEVLGGIPDTRVGADEIGLEGGDESLAMFIARPDHGRG